MWLSECQPLNRNRIWHTCTQLKKCELPHRVFDLNVTCHQEKAWSNISRAIIKCYKQLCFIHWHSLSSPFHFECLVIEIHWMWEMPQAGQQWKILFPSPQLLQKRFQQGALNEDPHQLPAQHLTSQLTGNWRPIPPHTFRVLILANKHELKKTNLPKNIFWLSHWPLSDTYPAGACLTIRLLLWSKRLTATT